MNKLRKFYKHFKTFVDDLTVHIKENFPNIDQKIKQLNNKSLLNKANLARIAKEQLP